VLARLLDLPEGKCAVVSDALLRLDHAPTLERLDRELEDAVHYRPPTWTAGHATKWLVPHVRAAFARSRERATERFSTWFHDDALAGDEGTMPRGRPIGPPDRRRHSSTPERLLLR
jgi:hypothetical protein